MLVGDSQTKLASFRSAVRQFKNNESSAKDMVDTVYHVLDEDVTATSGVVREIAKLFDGDDEREKQQAIIASLSNFRVEVSYWTNGLELTSARRVLPGPWWRAWRRWWQLGGRVLWPHPVRQACNAHRARQREQPWNLGPCRGCCWFPAPCYCRSEWAPGARSRW